MTLRRRARFRSPGRCTKAISAARSTREGIALINGLQDVLGAGVTFLHRRRHHPRRRRQRHRSPADAGDDIIDGDKWLDVQIGVFAVTTWVTYRHAARAARQHDHAGERDVQRHDQSRSAAQSSGRSAAHVRDQRTRRRRRCRHCGVPATFGPTTHHAQCQWKRHGHACAVTDGLESDGTDTLWNIERLRFSDIEIGLTPLRPRRAGDHRTTPTEGQPLRSMPRRLWTTTASVHSPSSGSRRPMALAGRASPARPCIVHAGCFCGHPSALSRRALRVIVSFTDGLGTAEQVISSATGPVGADWDATPRQQAIPLMPLPATISLTGRASFGHRRERHSRWQWRKRHAQRCRRDGYLNGGDGNDNPQR